MQYSTYRCTVHIKSCTDNLQAIKLIRNILLIYAVLIWGDPYAYRERTSVYNSPTMRKMVTGRGKFTLREIQAAEHVAEETNNCGAARRVFCIDCQ